LATVGARRWRHWPPATAAHRLRTSCALVLKPPRSYTLHCALLDGHAVSARQQKTETIQSTHLPLFFW
jgi:hypothetical protein